MRSLTHEIDTLLKDGRLTAWNLPYQSYNRVTVEHFIRYHWPLLQAAHENGNMSGSEFENDLHLIWIDLSESIKKLPHNEKRAIDLLTQGYNIHGKKGIAWIMGKNRRALVDLLNNAYRLIVDQLEPTE